MIAAHKGGDYTWIEGKNRHPNVNFFACMSDGRPEKRRDEAFPSPMFFSLAKSEKNILIFPIAVKQ